MKDGSSSGEWSEHNEEARQIWNANAEWWDDRIGDGNDFQDVLIEPTTERLLEVEPGTVVLDVGCGGGRFARRMVQLGAHVVAFDFSERFIQRAKARTPVGAGKIEYHVIDATDKQQLLSLGRGRFDGAVATMSLMDMSRIKPLMSVLPALLKPGGWFVFSVVHPCFQPVETCKFAESVESDGQVLIKRGVKVSHYLTPKAYKSIGIIGQPKPQYYFHRPLHMMFNVGFAQGFVIDAFEEPAFPEDPKDKRYLMWKNIPEIPPVIVARMRLLR